MKMEHEMAKIIENKIQCLHCLKVIKSRHTHDFKMCKCGKVGVDGGLDYLRRIGEPKDYLELSTIIK